jgi:hypothetical protein
MFASSVPNALAAGLIVWQGTVDVATGGGERGPWRMNESRYEYVDDPTVAIDERGIAVAWVDQAQKDVFFRRYSADGKPLGAAVNVSRSPRVFSWLPRIALAPDGAILLLWQEIIFSGGSHGGDILFARSSDGGRTFSAPLNLSNSVGGDGKGRINPLVWHNGSLDIALAADGAIYTAWTEYEGALWISRSTDGGATFTPPQRVPDSKPARAPALAVHGSTVYLAWTVGDDESADIRVAKSTDAGKTFSAPMIVGRSRAYSDAPKLAVDPQGVPHLVYSEGRRILYSRAFEPARDISGTGAGFPALSTDEKGRIYVLWERFAERARMPRGLGLAISTDGGRSFASAEVPGSAGDGSNGSSQGLLMRKLAVGRNGDIAIVNSSFQEGKRSRVWLMRARPGG